MATNNLTLQLHDTVDAQVWAKEWLRVLEEHPDICKDEGAMLGWFANAIMVGYDHGYQRALECVESSIEKSTRRFLEELELENLRKRSWLSRKLRALRRLPSPAAPAKLGLSQPGEHLQEKP